MTGLGQRPSKPSGNDGGDFKPLHLTDNGAFATLSERNYLQTKKENNRHAIGVSASRV